jgi:hypothetical protein
MSLISMEEEAFASSGPQQYPVVASRKECYWDFGRGIN